LIEEPLQDWLWAHQERLHGWAVEALVAVAEYYISDNAPSLAAEVANKLLIIEPLYESGNSLLMYAQSTLGQFEAALRTYQRYEEHYCAELEAPPSQTMLELSEQIQKEMLA
jgi:two-component SAPR family response regulator